MIGAAVRIHAILLVPLSAHRKHRFAYRLAVRM
jgi:hypothetical protein